MPAVYLSEDDVDELLDMETSIEVIEAAFQALAAGKAVNIPRRRAQTPGAVLHVMSAAAEYLGLLGLKAYATVRGTARFHVSVYDAATAELKAVIAADRLGQLRTGAASGVATDWLARPDARIVGVFGTGKQARTQLQAVCRVRKIERVDVYSPNSENRERFAEEMSELCVTRVRAVHSPAEAVEDKDVVVCATTAKTPVFDGRLLAEGTHLNVVGSNWPSKAEIDAQTVRTADAIVCDDLDACRLEAGDLLAAVEEGAAEWNGMVSLADVVAGHATGRAVPQDVTLFKSVGLALEDLALAAKLLEIAAAEGIGTPLPF